MPQGKNLLVKLELGPGLHCSLAEFLINSQYFTKWAQKADKPVRTRGSHTLAAVPAHVASSTEGGRSALVSLYIVRPFIECSPRPVPQRKMTGLDTQSADH